MFLDPSCSWMPKRRKDREMACKLLFLILHLAVLSPLPAASARRGSGGGDGIVISQADYQGLQAIKHELEDPRGFLRSWNDTGLGACSGDWVGIKCVLGKVVAIQLPWRGLGGSLSERLGQLTALRRLSIHDNAIGGSIPTSLGFLPELRGVYLFNNRFAGAVPAAIGRCAALQALDVSNNLLTGAIPPSIANSTKLLRLNLSYNAISGDLPESIASSASLMFLDLSHNRLSGPVPDAFGGSKQSSKEAITGEYQLVSLNLAHNGLTGAIPASLSLLKKLQEVVLDGNRLSGSIPEQLGTLPELQRLDLSDNNLTGAIPATLAGLTRLTSFNVSYNNLSGPVPGSLSEKFSPSSFRGNILLCGYSASVPCPNAPPPSPAPSAPASPARGVASHRKHSTKEIILIVSGIVLGILLLLLLCCLLLCCLTRRRPSGGGGKQSKEAGAGAGAGRGEKPGPGAGPEAESGGDVGGKLVHFDGPMAFTADDLLCATAEIMGKSTYGTVYKATLEDGGQVAVKRLREKVTKGQKEFEAEAGVLGKIRHPNLLPLRAYYLGPKGEKLLVFDFMPKGSLSSFLHARAPDTPIDWPTRMAIAQGTARGLSYLHDDVGTVHGNLTSSNVLLDEAASPRIADFGLSRLMTAAANSSVLAAAGALGYRAPELSKLKKASAKTDVYSLGVILLELLTGKSPADTTNGLDLPQWVASIVKEEWTSEVFDVELMRGAAGDELMDTLKLALHCVDPSPAVRPEAREVLRQLEQVRPGPGAAAAGEGAGPSEGGGMAHGASASNE